MSFFFYFSDKNEHIQKMNTITITGRLLKMPEIKVHEKDGYKTYIAKYILVSRKPFATKGNSINYIYCEARGSSAIFAKKYFTIGKNIGVQGYLDTRTFIGSDGKRRSKWAVIVERQEFLESKSVEKRTLSTEEHIENIVDSDISMYADLPF